MPYASGCMKIHRPAEGTQPNNSSSIRIMRYPYMFEYEIFDGLFKSITSILGKLNCFPFLAVIWNFHF